MVKLKDLKVGECFRFPSELTDEYIYVVVERKRFRITYQSIQTTHVYSTDRIGPQIMYEHVSKLNTSIVSVLYG